MTTKEKHKEGDASIAFCKNLGKAYNLQKLEATAKDACRPDFGTNKFASCYDKKISEMETTARNVCPENLDKIPTYKNNPPNKPKSRVPSSNKNQTSSTKSGNRKGFWPR